MSKSKPQPLSRIVRVDTEVHRELLRRRLPGETNHDAVILRALEEQKLEDQHARIGLSTESLLRLYELQEMRARR